jgi:steroid delta-isomerase-like uncharacterized protein
MAADAKTIARRWFVEVWDERRDAAIDELMSLESVGHVEGRDARGPAEFREMRASFLAALPDMRMHVEDVVGEGDRAAVRWRVEATHAGDGFGFPATNQRVQARGTTWLTVRNGQIVEGWDTWNFGGLMQFLRG